MAIFPLASNYATQLFTNNNTSHGTSISTISTSISGLVNQTQASTTGAIATGTIHITGSAFITIDKGLTSISKDLLPGSYPLPDGAKLIVDNDGNYRIEDKDAKVTYKASRIREFNRFINASDLLEQFIRDLGALRVPQDKVLQIPLELFISWLVIKAAEADGDTPPQDTPRLEHATSTLRAPRCRWCGRFIRQAMAKQMMVFCNGQHFTRYQKRANNAQSVQSVRLLCANG
jgi:hypothetical protein